MKPTSTTRHAALTMFVTDLTEVERLARERRDEFDVMRYMLELEDELSDAEIDARVEAIARPIVDAIDCTACANCCRALQVSLTPADTRRLGEGLDVPLDMIEARYADRARGEAEGEWAVMRGRPCPFLAGRLCGVYEHRPESCRIFPDFTPDFRWTLAHTIENAPICPIIYNLLSAMVDEVDRMTRR